MGKWDEEKAGKEEKVLHFFAETQLPHHKTAASLDDLDRAILEKHLKDVFFPYRELAEQWNVTTATIRNRIKRMKADGVMEVILVINPYRIGYNTFALIGINVDPNTSIMGVVSTLLSYPNVINAIVTSGRFDIFIQLVCQNLEEYRRFMDEDFRKVEGISSIESFIGLDLGKRKFNLGIIDL